MGIFNKGHRLGEKYVDYEVEGGRPTNRLKKACSRVVEKKIVRPDSHVGFPTFNFSIPGREARRTKA